MTTANKWVLIGGGPSPVLSGRRVAQRGDLLFRRLLSAGQGPALKTPHSGVTLSLAANDTHKRCSGDINKSLLPPSLPRDLSVFFVGFVSEGQREKRDVRRMKGDYIFSAGLV